MITAYLVVCQQVWANETGHGVDYQWDGHTYADRPVALAAGFNDFGHNDFNIATVRDGVLVAFGFGYTDFAPGDTELAEIGRQLCLPVAAEVAQ